MGIFGKKVFPPAAFYRAAALYPAAALAICCLVPMHLFGDDSSARAKLIGVWQPQDAAAKDAGVWTFEQKGGEVIHITYSVGDQKVTEIECATTGKECNVKDSGKSAKVSMWFNGSRLVALETRGGEVVKRRFGVADGDALEVETIPVQPDGKTEKLEFRRTKK